MRFAAVAAAAAAADCPAAAAAAAANSRPPAGFLVHSPDDTEDAGVATPGGGLPLPAGARPVLSSWLRPGTGDTDEWALPPSSSGEEGGPIAACSCCGRQPMQRPVQGQEPKQHARRQKYWRDTPSADGDEALSDGESSLPSASSVCTLRDSDAITSGSDAATSAPRHAAPCSRRTSPATREHQRSQPYRRTCQSRDSASSANVARSSAPAAAVAEARNAAAEAVAAAAAARESIEGPADGLSTRLCLRGVFGGLVKWFAGPSLLEGCSRLMCDGMQGLLLMLLRLQRQQLLRRLCPDLMEKYTHTLSGGLLRAERHSVRTSDGHEIHFYRLRKVSRCCCGIGCACATLGFDARPADAALQAAAAAAAEAGVAAAASGSRDPSNLSDDNNDCNGQVFFFEHGLLESSLNWITGGWLSLPFIVAARGGEVWLANSRGNEYTRLLKSQQRQQHPQSRLQQHIHSFALSHPCRGGPTGQSADQDQSGYSLFTLHEFIAQEQDRLHALQTQEQRDGQAEEEQRRQFEQLQQHSLEEEEECCSLFCCRCSSVTSLPSLQGKSQHERQQVLLKACVEASAGLLRMQWAAAAADTCESSAAQQRQEDFMRATGEGNESDSLPLGESSGEAAEANEALGEVATGAGAATTTAPTDRSTHSHGAGLLEGLGCHSKDSLKKAFSLSTGSTLTASTRESACRLPTNCTDTEQLYEELLGDEADTAAASAERLPLEEGSTNILDGRVVGPNSSNGTAMCTKCFCCCCGCNSNGSSSSSSNTNISSSSADTSGNNRRSHRTLRGRCSNAPPFEFCRDSAEGQWSFNEMAMYDCPAQLQYIAMNSPALRRRRAAVLAAAAASTSSSNSKSLQSAFGCGLIAVGQSQGAAQLLVALSTSPSVCLLAPRMVLFSPPLVLQPLRQLPYAALILMRLGLRYPTLLLKALRAVVGFTPAGILAAVGNAVVGAERPGSMRFYSTPLQHQQLVLNFSHTPSGRPYTLGIICTRNTYMPTFCYNGYLL